MICIARYTSPGYNVFMTNSTAPYVPLSIRIPRELDERITRAVEDASRRAVVGEVSRSDVIRALLERGLDVLDDELGRMSAERKK